MVRIFELEQIRPAVDPDTARQALAEGFMAYSRGDAELPEVGELLFRDPPGDVHIKHGYIAGDEHFVIKVATGFYDNPARGLPAQDGVMLVHERATGRLAYLLLDHGWLTDLRTALAGAVVAELLAPARVDRIGVFGTGVQARLQVQYLDGIVDCRRLLVWGRTPAHAERYAGEFAERGYEVQVAADAEAFADCQLIITATPASTPLLQRVAAGTHVTAVGTDSPHKNEIAPDVFRAADQVVVDSRHQCLTRGDLRHAVAAGAISADEVVELGTLLASAGAGRRDDRAITVADLTGLAVQDICIARHVINALSAE